MVTYLLRRLILAFVSILGVLVITFTLSHVVPGDPAALVAGKEADPQVIEQVREELGLNKPLYQQFLLYFERLFLKFDLGKSIISKRPVVEDIKAYFPATFELVAIPMILVTVLGVWTGAISAIWRNSVLDHIVRIITLSGISIPIFWLALMLQLFAISIFTEFPIDGRVSITVLLHHPMKNISGLYIVDSMLQHNWPVFKSAVLHIILPALTVTFCSIAQITRITRAAMIQVMYQDYIRTAEAMGISSLKIIYKYGLRNTFIPVLTVVGMIYKWLLAGSVLLELIFSWPGIGRYAVNAIFSLDFPAIMGVTIFSSMIVIFLNLIIDMLYPVINPTVKYE